MERKNFLKTQTFALLGEERERDLENMKIERRKHGNEPLRVWHTRNPQKESLEKVEIEAM